MVKSVFCKSLSFESYLHLKFKLEIKKMSQMTKIPSNQKSILSIKQKWSKVKVEKSRSEMALVVLYSCI
jgi:hypothetical protein